MNTDSARLDFLQRHPHCVVACKATPKDNPRWTAEQPVATRNAFKIFSSLRDAIDYAMGLATGIAPVDLVAGDYCRAGITTIGKPGESHVRLCQVVEDHGHILQVFTATRKKPIAIYRKDVVGLGWRKA